MSEAVLARCEAWTAKHGDFMDESGLQVLLQGISSSEVSLLYKAFAGSEAEKLPLLPFVQWLFKALVDTPPAARAPEESGVPLQEFTRLLTEHKAWLSTATWNPHTGCACRPNMYDVVETIIKPLTKARLVSYAELLEPLAPQVFVSHWWGEEFVCFVRALQLFAGTCMSQASSDFTDASNTPEANSDPGANLAFWVCSFANRQWEVNLGSTLQESPFERALAAPSCTHVVMIMDPDATPLQRIWCLYEVLRAHALKKKFHIATDNGVLTFGSDEPFGQQRQDLLTLTKRVLEIDPATAKASQEQDRCMIMAEVDKAVGLEQFGLHVMSLLAWAFRRRGGEQLAMDAPELKPRFFRLVRLGEMLVTFEGRTTLHCVAQRKEPPEVRLALTAAAAEDLACCNSLGQTPLHVAAAYNRHVDVIDLLITARMDVNARDRNGLTPWMLSAATGHHEALVRLLAWGADLSCDLDLWQFDKVPWEAKTIPNGLFMAAFSGSSECCQIFLSRAAKVHEVMLIAACIGGNVAALQTMLPHAEHVISRGGPFSPLFSASFCGQLDCVDLLLRHKALPNQTCDGGKTAFFAAMACGYEDVGRLLLSYRADPWIRTEADDTALLVASGGGHDGCVRMMLSLRANLHQTCGEAEGKVLHVAAEWGREQTVRLLVESRADPKAVDKKQRTPLHKAADHGYVEILAALLELNADPRAVDSAGDTALDVARFEGMEEAADYLREVMHPRQVTDISRRL
ncbi:ANKRD50 [Symbiodinium necroappetens]|uniref:ANKRD50 protein n=1 Tax=Symbiodinium necroappetens TaxID=1628268 RepID=A0A812QNX1_9DINO|nr:ANKRD50 [Symbiodinium necroappetens]